MIRTFAAHKIRKQTELTGRLWEFCPSSGEHAGEVYPVMTPCCWENIPDLMNYRGRGVFSTTVSAGGNIRLEFKGVSHTARVFLDGEEIASHYNAYTAFSAVLRDVEPGEHRLSIEASNLFGPESALHIPNDYMSYGGVSRPVVLEEIGRVYVKQLHITPHKTASGWTAEVKVLLENISGTDEKVGISLKVAGESRKTDGVAVPAHDRAAVQELFRFENVEEWTEKTPSLYYAEAEVSRDGAAEDDLIERFGFREITVSGKDILLNGEKLKIRGVCRHEDHPQFGCALPPSAMMTDLQWIKDIGANSVRTAHYPNDEVFLDLCDELGILVWEENHARGLSEQDMCNPNFEPQAEQVIREMIPLHYNHPCIYIWGILNECASDTEYGRACYEKQLKLIKELDSTRPTSFASCKFKTDICFDLPDVDSYNIYPLWYHDTDPAEYLDDLYRWIQNETGGAGKPFLITEIGAGGIYGYRSHAAVKWTEEYQAQALKRQIEAVMNYEDCSGIYIWQFCDIRISEEWFHTRPRTMNNKGIFDEYRRPKLCYDVVKKAFRG